MTASYGLSLLPLTSPGLLLSPTLPAFTASPPAAGVQALSLPRCFSHGPPACPLGCGGLPFQPGPVCKLQAVPREEAHSQPQRPGLPDQPSPCPLGDWLDMTGTAK